MLKSKIPEAIAILENSPKIRPVPMAISPHIFNISTQYNVFGFDARFRKISENNPSESSKKPTLDQFGLVSFTRPSYKKCQPMDTLNATSQNNW